MMQVTNIRDMLQQRREAGDFTAIRCTVTVTGEVEVDAVSADATQVRVRWADGTVESLDASEITLA